MAKNEEMFSMSYEDAKNKYGTGLGNNKMFMPKETFTKKQAELNKTKQEEKPKKTSLVADKFGNKKEKTWNDVKAENGNDPEKIKDYLNNNPSYKAGNLTKKGMEEFGYAQGKDGKWAVKEPTTDTTTEDTTTSTESTTITTTPYTPDTESDTKPTTPTNTTTPTTNATTEDLKKRLEELTKKDEDLQKQLKQFQDKYGNFNEKKTIDAMAQYEQKMVEMGAGKFDKDNKFILKDTTKKGWEDYATMLSAGLSVIGLAMGIPIIPINFRKITNKDEKDAKIREFQKQYTDIFANGAAKVNDVESSAEAGKDAKEYEEDIKSYSKYKEDVGAYKAKSDIDTDKETKLINENLKAEMALVDAEFKNKIGEMKLSHEQQKDLQTLMSDLSTDSAKELLNQERYKYLLDMTKDMKAAGMDEKAIALKLQSLAGNTPSAQNIKHAQNIAKIFTDFVNAAGNIAGKGKGK